jgi:hypothetical protein
VHLAPLLSCTTVSRNVSFATITKSESYDSNETIRYLWAKILEPPKDEPVYPRKHSVVYEAAKLKGVGRTMPYSRHGQRGQQRIR